MVISLSPSDQGSDKIWILSTEVGSSEVREGGRSVCFTSTLEVYSCYSPMAHQVKSSPSMQETQGRGFNPWVGKIPWRSKRQPTPLFLPGKSHGQRSLVGYSPRGHTESHITEYTRTAHISLFSRGLFTSYKPTPC